MLLNSTTHSSGFRFLNKRWYAFVISALLIVASITLCFTRGLNFGIDFTGGILIEVEFENPPAISALRKTLSAADIGDVSLQTIGSPNHIMIRVGQAKSDTRNQADLVTSIKSILSASYPNIDYRKVDYVGPKVGHELILDGALSILIALIAIMVYIWFRFEWQYGVSAVLALVHDVIITFGFYAFSQLDFNLTSVAAVLTIIGYSINDSVVIFDRIRENVRKYRKMPLDELIDNSINQNLSRTLLTSFTTIIALLALVVLGGEVILSFSAAALIGIVVGTYSSIYIASSLLIYMKLRRDPS